VTTPEWKKLGFLTPDAPDCQREVWALAGLLRGRLAETCASLAETTAEPTWHRTLEEHASSAAKVATDLLDEAGTGATTSVGDDPLVRELDGMLGEVVASGHVPSLLCAGYAVMGEVALVPVRLLDEVAGIYARTTAGPLLSSEDHRILGRLAGIVDVSHSDSAALRRMLRHLHGRLADVHMSWRQTFHVLGVDGEEVTSSSRLAAQEALKHLGLPAGRTDLSMFRDV
jgi:hypothetical protein